MRDVCTHRTGAIVILALLMTTTTATVARGDDWPQFRGPGGLGIAAAADAARVPLTWDEKTNIAWRCPLPGPGSSSPVIFGKHAYLTCYSGYGITKESPGNMADLKRHLLCVRLADGGIEWTATLPVHKQLKESGYNSFVTCHGYASSTPAVDDTGVYVFYGTLGLIAYDLKGAHRWTAPCGELYMNFGSAASPVLYKDLVIINADVESKAIIAFRKSDGKEAWRYEPDKDINTWCTPVIYKAAAGDELACFGGQNELIALDPAAGKLLWRCTIAMGSYQCPSQIFHDGVVYAIGNHPGDAAAVRAGGRGDVSSTHKLWGLRKGSVCSSPIYRDGHLYWASEENGKVYCAEAATGKLVYEEKLDPKPGLIYSSATLVGDRILYVSQKNGTYVVDAKPTFKLLARNVIADDESIFNGSPAIGQGRMLLRSNQALYCVVAK